MTANETEGHRYKLSDIEPLPSLEEEEKRAYPGMSHDSIQRDLQQAENAETGGGHVPNLAETEAVTGGPVVPLPAEEAGNID